MPKPQNTTKITNAAKAQNPNGGVYSCILKLIKGFDGNGEKKGREKTGNKFKENINFGNTK